MKKVFIFGGSFDPVHLGHLAVIKSALNYGDELRLVPAGPNPEGKTYLFAPYQRLSLLKASLGLFDSREIASLPLGEKIKRRLEAEPLLSPKIIICEDELKQEQTAYTISLIRTFLEREPSLELNLIVGADQAAQFYNWKSPEELLKLVKLWTLPREGFRPQEGIPWNFLEFSPVRASSTEIRRRLSQGDPSWLTLLPPPASLLAPFYLKNPLS